MRLSIVVPVYNVQKYISYCLDSLLNQSLNVNDYEIILINDGSTDGSLSICENYEEQHSNIYVYTQQNSGVGAARNKGMSLAKGEYIYFLDPDDYLAKETLPELLKITAEHSPDLLAFRSISTEVYTQQVSRSDLTNYSCFDIMNGDSYIAEHAYKNEIWWYFIRKEYLQKADIVFIEGRWMEDAIFTAEVLLNAKRIMLTDLDVHRHVKVPDSAMTSKEPAHYLRVINDNVNAAHIYDGLIAEQRVKGARKETIARLKTRQESFAFFLIIRAMRSEMMYDEFKSILNKLKSCNAYPMHNFIGTDYNAVSYKLLVPIFNSKAVLLTAFRVSRIVKQLTG
jgi:glycosyltransferase involved in cell wall biosynthesis